MKGKITNDFSHLKLHDEDPVCPHCGTICELHSRKGVWECCEYSITLEQWDIIRLHASVVKSLLQGASIGYIEYSGVPIEVEHAVSASHFLPMLILMAQDIGEAVGMEPLLSLKDVSEAVLDSGGLLLPFTIQLNSTGCSVLESINLISAATRSAIDEFRNSDSIGTIMDQSFFTTTDDNAEAA